MNDLSSLQEVQTPFQGIKVANLKRSELGVAFSFEEVFDSITGTYELLKNLAGQEDILKDENYVPTNLVGSLTEHIKRFNTLAKQIEEFDVTAGDPTPRRQTLINEIRTFKTNVISHLHPLIALVQLRQL